MADFDPYHEWLGISPEDRPINYYSLLSLRCFEPNANVISNAADCKMAYLKTFQTGPHSNEAQKILNVLAKARVTLLNPEQKAKYDAQLRKLQAARQVPIPPLKSSEPAVLSTPKRPEPTVKSAAKRPEPQESSLLEINKQILQVFIQSNLLAYMIEERKTKLERFKSQCLGLPFIWHQIFPSKKYTKTLQNLENDIQRARKAKAQCFLNISFSFTPSEREKWDYFLNLIKSQSFENVLSSWKIPTEYDTDVYRAENGEYNVPIFNLTDCVTSIGNWKVLHSTEPYVLLGNETVDCLFIYPSFVIIMNQHQCKIVPPEDLELGISRVNIVSESNPKDANVIDYGWKYAKKDGGKDLRYKDNKKVYVLELFKLEIDTKSNYKAAYLFGREDVANCFATILKQQVEVSLLPSGDRADIESISEKEWAAAARGAGLNTDSVNSFK